MSDCKCKDKNCTKEDLKDHRDYIFKYFSYLVDQRFKGIQFYILVATALFAFLATSQNNNPEKIIMLIGFIFITIIFWLLDCRTRDLIKSSERILFENDHRLKKASVIVLEF